MTLSSVESKDVDDIGSNITTDTASYNNVKDMDLVSTDKQFNKENDNIIDNSTSKTLTKKEDTSDGSGTKEATTKNKVVISSKSVTAYAYQQVTFNATAKLTNNESLKDAKVSVKINGKTIGQTRVKNGLISLNYTIPKLSANKYNVTIIVGETSKTLTATKNITLTIKRSSINITTKTVKTSSASKIKLNATVKYTNGSLVNGAKAVFKINGKTIGSAVVTNGKASITYIVPAKAGNYSVVVKIGETTLTNYKNKTFKLVVSKRNPKIDVDSLFFVKKGYSLTLKVKINNTGYSNATGNVGFKVNGKTVGIVKVVDGVASYRYDASSLKKGVYNISVVYSGSSALNSARKNTVLRVQDELVSTYGYSQILKKANLTYEFILNNKKLPNYALMNENEVSMADFLYLMTQTLTNKNSLHNGGFSTPTSKTKTLNYGAKIYEDEYISLARTIVNTYIKSGRAPNTIKTKSNITMSFEDTVYCYTRILNYLDVNGVLPLYSSVLKMNPSSSGSSSSGSSSSGSSSTSTGTSNYVSTNKVPVGYEGYLVSAENAYVNSTVIKNAVKSAVSGVTGTYNQAVAIFNYVSKKTDYSSYFNTKYGAIETLNLGYGNCVDQAHLLLGMYRTAKIPARYCHATCTFRSGLVVGHVWVEAYVNGKWYSCDTTSNYNSFGNIVNWYSSTAVNRYISISF